MKESMHVKFDKYEEKVQRYTIMKKIRRAIPHISPKSQRIVDYHAQDQIIGNSEGILNYFL
jgi:hypothetical protein